MMKKLIIVAAFVLFGAFVFVPALIPMSDLIWRHTVKPAVDPIAFLMDRINQPIPGIVIRPKTTAELKKWFQEADRDHVPRVFVDQMPVDFKTEGNQKLFAQVISALILRENEKIIKERAILALLAAKSPDGEKWTQKERDFFNDLIKRYDSRAKKTVSAGIADLAVKVHPIPPLVGVLQAAEATDWGKKSWDSPFGQTGWLNKETYALLPFKSLIRATESYVTEMNGLPPLNLWRHTRSEGIKAGSSDIGYSVLRWLGDYKQDDPEYAEKLIWRSGELEQEVPDNLSFIKPVQLAVGPVKIGTHTFQMEFAKTTTERKRGLMFRTFVPPDTGMIFINEAARPMGVWMRNTFVPLDVLFFDQDKKVIGILEDLRPLDETPHRSVKPALGMVELPAGTVQKHNIKIGEKIVF